MWVRLIPAIAAALVVCAGSPASGADGAPEEAPAEEREPIAVEGAFTEEGRAEESEQARRFSRARREHEAGRTERVEKLEAERRREQEVTLLKGTVSALGRRESYLRHEKYWARREYDSMSRDPSDLSTMVRRSALERELHDIRSQLGTVSPGRENTLRQLDTLRLR